MRRFLLILLLLSGSFSLVSAQKEKDKLEGREKRFEKIQALKIAFITQKLELSSDEAQKFWPVFNRYEVDMKQVWRDNRNGADALDKEEKILNVKKRFRTDFIKIIGQQKTNTLFNAEKEFRNVLMNQLKNKHGEGEHNRPK